MLYRDVVPLAEITAWSWSLGSSLLLVTNSGHLGFLCAGAKKSAYLRWTVGGKKWYKTRLGDNPLPQYRVANGWRVTVCS